MQCYVSVSSCMPVFQIETCRFSSHSAPSLMTQLIATVPSNSLHYDSVITDCICFSFPLNSLSLFLFVKLQASVCLPLCLSSSEQDESSSERELLAYWRKCLLTFRHRLVLCRGAVCYLWLRALCDWLRGDIIMSGTQLSQFQSYNRYHVEFTGCQVTKWKV